MVELAAFKTSVDLTKSSTLHICHPIFSFLCTKVLHVSGFTSATRFLVFLLFVFINSGLIEFSIILSPSFCELITSAAF